MPRSNIALFLLFFMSVQASSWRMGARWQTTTSRRSLRCTWCSGGFCVLVLLYPMCSVWGRQDSGVLCGCTTAALCL